MTDFLGIVVDAEAQCLRYPADKTAEVLAELRRLQSGATRTKLQLLSLLGKLGFADIVFPLARPFVSELYRLSHSVSKDYHHVKLSGRAHGDVANWINVLTSADGLPLLDRDIDAATTAATARGDWACGVASGAGGYGFYNDTSFVAIEWARIIFVHSAVTFGTAGWIGCTPLGGPLHAAAREPTAAHGLPRGRFADSGTPGTDRPIAGVRPAPSAPGQPWTPRHWQ